VLSLLVRNGIVIVLSHLVWKGIYIWNNLIIIEKDAILVQMDSKGG
jgi:hypothetical protein